ncbi:MAG: flippase activity-associated protein Agl23 [Acidobacteriota bacterium]
MNRAAFGCVVAGALLAALTCRLAGLDLRPMHHDEANQAVKFGTLLESGDYRYDRDEHHGPTLYYLTLPMAWVRGQTTLASLDEHTLRAVPAVFGAALILLLVPLAAGLGRGAMAGAAVLTALSPALTYYSRFYIQESLLAFFALGFVVLLGRYLQRPGVAAACGAGAFAGLAFATKETALIVLPAALAAAIVAQRATRPPGPTARPWARHGCAAVATAVGIAVVLYSSFFRHPRGVLESVLALSTYAGRGIAVGPHTQPWNYYLGVLSYSRSGGLVWSEGLVLVLAACGLAATVRRSDAGFWPRYVALYSVLVLVAYSAIGYKTPWNLLPFYVGLVVLAGYGAAAMMGAARSRTVRTAVALALMAAACQLGAQNWRANFGYPADTRNPYVYAQTSSDLLRLTRRITALAAVHPDRDRMLIKVIADPHQQWPLPWYLRRMTRVGYWTRAQDAGPLADAPVIVASQENADQVGAAVGDQDVSEFYGLRPDILLTLYVDRALWARLVK